MAQRKKCAIWMDIVGRKRKWRKIKEFLSSFCHLTRRRRTFVCYVLDGANNFSPFTSSFVEWEMEQQQFLHIFFLDIFTWKIMNYYIQQCNDGWLWLYTRFRNGGIKCMYFLRMRYFSRVILLFLHFWVIVCL